MNEIIKKGAMFGLDTRISLVIFGALSVISGAALYSAIEKANITSKYTTLIETGKAFEALYIDTGILRVTSVLDNYNAEDLYVDNSVVGWKGPYQNIGSLIKGSHSLIKYNGSAFSDYDVLVRNLKSNSWDLTSDWEANISCKSKVDNCSLWIQLVTLNLNDKLGYKLDEMFDDSIDDYGNIMYGVHNGAYQIFIKIMPHNAQ
jgi:hypothetical protein